MEILLTAAIAFTFAGTVKGILGFGFPIIALVVLTLSVGLLDALALIVVPTLVTNVWQAVDGPHLGAVWQRMWLYFVLSVAGIFFAARFLTVFDVEFLTALLGGVLFFFALTRLLNVHLSVPRERETLFCLVLGPLNGLLTGSTGTFMVPSVLYMQALGFPRDMLVQAMGIFFALSTLALTVSLGANGLISWDDGVASTLALLPSFAGIYVGRWTRKRIDEARFQRLFLYGLILLGSYLVWRALASG
jgi:uncharacterized membrane protein YfcA